MGRDGLDESTSAGGLAELRRRNEELEVLCDTIRDLTSTLAVHEVIARLLDRILLHLEAEIGSVLLLDGEGELRIVDSCGLPIDVVSTTRIGPEEGISGHVLATGRSLLVSDVEHDERFRRRNHERYYTRSCISAPLVIEGEARGVINVNNKSNREVFHDSDLMLLEAIAGHAAMALANAHRFEEMLERSRRDPLTGLANHGHFWSCLDVETERSRRYERPLSVVLVDIDHFKPYNDRHGHRRALRGRGVRGRPPGDDARGGGRLRREDPGGDRMLRPRLREPIRDHDQRGRRDLRRGREDVRRSGSRRRPGAVSGQGAGAKSRLRDSPAELRERSPTAA
jgi:GAF domain-containing protein